MELIKDLSVAAITNAICKNFWFRQETQAQAVAVAAATTAALAEVLGFSPEAFIGLIKRKCLRPKRAQVGFVLVPS